MIPRSIRSSWIEAEADDAQPFIERVNLMITSLARQSEPADVAIVKIDNWFSRRWHSFAGKALGALPIWRDEETIVPPFVPSRVVSQTRFEGPGYEPGEPLKDLHVWTLSRDALYRRLNRIAPNVLCVWFSAQSASAGRAASMFYVPAGENFHKIYIGWMAEPWRPEVLIGLSRQELLKHIES